jgi:flagellar protein FlbD
VIVLSKLDGVPILVNLDAIKYIESIPDTLLHFINGDSLIVRENLAELEQKVMEARAKVIRMSTNSEG